MYRKNNNNFINVMPGKIDHVFYAFEEVFEMYKNILITGGTSRISFHLKMISNKYHYSPKREEWDLSNLDFDKKIDLIKM